MHNPYNDVFDLRARERYFTSAGNRVKPVFSGKYMSDGTIRLSKVDEIDVQDEINSHLHECDLELILSRLMDGDTSVIQRANPMYGDFTQFPRSYVEMLQLVQDGSAFFDSLDPDIKLKFDNDRAKWFATIGNDDWFSKMGYASNSSVASSSVVSPASSASDPVSSSSDV